MYIVLYLLISPLYISFLCIFFMSPFISPFHISFLYLVYISPFDMSFLYLISPFFDVSLIHDPPFLVPLSPALLSLPPWGGG